MNSTEINHINTGGVFRELRGVQNDAVTSNQTTVISAGAGSGKTMVLASRYAYLVVARKLKVEEILTLTFTKKAAAEMRTRIYQTLFRIANTGDGEEKQLARCAIENFSKSRIQTLDSFCSYVVHDSANRYGIRPDFIVDDSSVEELAHAAALPFFLSHRHRPAIKELLKFKTPDSIVYLLVEAAHSYANITQQVSFEQTAKKQADIIVQRWQETSDAIETLMVQVVPLIKEDDSLSQPYRDFMMPYVRAISDFIKNEGFVTKSEIERYFALIFSEQPDERISVMRHSQVRKRVAAYMRIVDKISGIRLNHGPANHPAKECIKKIKGLYTVFSPLAVYCLQAGLTFSLMPLIDEFLSEFILAKCLGGTLTFDDVSHLAVDLLLKNPEIRAAEKRRCKAIMIDEFQDNNERQKNLLYLLAEKENIFTQHIPASEDLEEGKLFFVGDEKQSIYRFRGADVSVFRKLCGEFSGRENKTRGKELHLQVNFRSSPMLIDSFNALCATIFAPERAKNFPDYEARFVPFLPHKGNENKNTQTQPITISCLRSTGRKKKKKTSDAMSDDEIEAYHVAKKIHEILKKENVAACGIAVLFRKGTVQHLYERYLRRFGIPYSSENQVSFFSDGPVNDIYALLRLAVYPHDRYSYAVLLRSPFINFSFENFSICMINCSEEPFSDSERASLPAQSLEMFDKGKALYSGICEKSKTLSCAELVTFIWYDCGYRYETLWNNTVSAYNELYDYLFELARREDDKGGSLVSFVASLQNVKKSGKKLEDMDIPLARHDAVRLLTIHKSKGLQFPIVFIPSCGLVSQSRGIEGELYKTEFGPSCNIPLPVEARLLKNARNNFFYENAKAEEEKKETAELRRLLYVAMTRAESRVYFSGHFQFIDGERHTPLHKLLVETIAEKQAKREKDESAMIYGDKILGEKTLFGLLLPAVSELYKNQKTDSESDPHPRQAALEEIKRITRTAANSCIKRTTGISLAARQRSKKNFAKDIAAMYGGAKIITTPIIPKNKISPASAALYDMFERVSQQKPVRYNIVEMVENRRSLGEMKKLTEQVDDIVAHYAGPDKQEGGAELYKDENGVLTRDKTIFAASDFGTIAHAAVESRLAGTKLIIPPQIDSLVTPRHSKILARNATALADFFLSTELGSAAKNAAKSGWLKSEYEFVTRVPRSEGKGFFIGGIIDLIFEDKHGVTIVDFKTDKEVNPGKHIPQMACYYQAAKRIRKKDVRVWIYYLRSGKAVDLTNEVIKANIDFGASGISLGDIH